RRQTADIEAAKKRRDDLVYDFLLIIEDLERKITKAAQGSSVGKVVQAIKRQRRNFMGPTLRGKWLLPFLIEYTHPELSPKARSKYANAIKYAQVHKMSGETIAEFVKKNGGLNACVAKAANERRQQRKLNSRSQRQRVRK